MRLMFRGTFCFHLSHWKWCHQIPPRCWYLSTGLHGVTFQEANLQGIYWRYRVPWQCGTEVLFRVSVNFVEVWCYLGNPGCGLHVCIGPRNLTGKHSYTCGSRYKYLSALWGTEWRGRRFSTRQTTDRQQTIQPIFKKVLPLSNEAHVDSKGHHRPVSSELPHAVLTHLNDGRIEYSSLLWVMSVVGW
jgi:hypothetical protein